MCKLSDETIAKNFSNFKRGLVKYVGKEAAEEIIDAVGGEDAIKNATYALTGDTGAAYKGSFTKNIIKLGKIAASIANNTDIFNEGTIKEDSIWRVVLLSQIAKVLLFVENDNGWEISNRGIIYKYNNDLKGALRVGERSTLIACNAGVKFSEEEFEAMKIIDKTCDEDNYKKYFLSPLSQVIKIASDIINIKNRLKC